MNIEEQIRKELRIDHPNEAPEVIERWVRESLVRREYYLKELGYVPRKDFKNE
jgi:hypothetical protein